jgi:hypothetical protein
MILEQSKPLAQPLQGMQSQHSTYQILLHGVARKRASIAVLNIHSVPIVHVGIDTLVSAEVKNIDLMGWK